MNIDAHRELLSVALNGLDLPAAFGDVKLEDQLRFVQSRERATVWSSNIFTRTARVPITLIVYALRYDPSARPHFEEELALLKALGERDPAAGPRLLFSRRTANIGLLITAEASDARILRESSGAGAPALRYDAARDRIIGGDRIEPRGEQWLSLCLLSQSRGERLIPLLTAAGDAHAQRAESCDPKFLLPAALALVSIEPIAVAGVPPAYEQLAQLALVISEPSELSARPADRTKMARRLLTILASVHRIGISLSSTEGSCISRGTITPAGGLIDAYYLTHVGTAPQQRRAYFRHDLHETLAVISESTHHEHREAALLAAATAYANPVSLPQSVLYQVRVVANALHSPRPLVVDPLVTLADALLAAGTS